MLAISLFSVVLCATSASASVTVNIKPADYLKSIGDLLDYDEFSMNAIKSAVNTVLEDPQVWTLNLLKSESEIFRGTGNRVSLLKHHEKYEICEACQEKHPRAKVLQVLCQFEVWVDALAQRENDSFATVAVLREEPLLAEALPVEPVMALIMPDEPLTTDIAPFGIEDIMEESSEDEVHVGDDIRYDLEIDLDEDSSQEA